jgi:phosphoenolpyruvate carboxykinase (GTP)
MAMLPFCGYNMGDYFAHWLDIGRKLTRPPKIFSINWFRTGDDGKFIWPGFGENIRVLKWAIDRVNGRVGAQETPIGHLPHPGDLDLNSLGISRENVDRLFQVNPDEWKGELDDAQAFFDKFGARFPRELSEELHGLRARLVGK